MYSGERAYWLWSAVRIEACSVESAGSPKSAAHSEIISARFSSRMVFATARDDSSSISPSRMRYSNSSIMPSAPRIPVDAELSPSGAISPISERRVRVEIALASVVAAILASSAVDSMHPPFSIREIRTRSSVALISV